MKIALIVATARNGVIGRAGGLAWRISDDMKRFRQVTLGRPVIMGRKTYDSIGKPLPGRANIVISRSVAAIDGVTLSTSLDAAIDAASAIALRDGVDEIFVIGGAEIYALALPRADRIYLTEVDAEIAGDAYFPRINPADWEIRADGRVARSERNEFACRFFILDRKNA